MNGERHLYKRYAEKKVIDAIADTPVVIITGPRQSGKTTLARYLQLKESVHLTLDDITQYKSAKSDPIGFIRNLNARHIVIDEVQRVPDLFLAIKQSVDENRLPGRYLLTGSSNALMLPRLSDSLAGRMEIINLLPLTTCEINNTHSTFLDKVFNNIVPTSKTTRVRKQLLVKILTGGFPEPFARKSQERRVMWYQQYINSLIQKDIKDLEKIEHLNVVPKLVRLLSNQVGQLINYTEIANKLEVTRQTVSHYVKLLEQLYLFEGLPAWSKNENKRLIKTPKIHIVDTGLLCAQRRLTLEKILSNPQIYGHLLESYVVNEIKRLATWYDAPIECSYYRDKDKIEVDLILEDYEGNLIGIEIKGSATITHNDFKGLRRLQSVAGKQFKMGLVLYDGDHSVPYGENLYTAPIGCLWE